MKESNFKAIFVGLLGYRKWWEGRKELANALSCHGEDLLLC
jgi:hypothetical protein